MKKLILYTFALFFVFITGTTYALELADNYTIGNGAETGLKARLKTEVLDNNTDKIMLKTEYLKEIKADFELAELGNAGALFRIGARYLNGSELPKDLDKAYEYLLNAAEKGHANAIYNVGYIYLYGLGKKIDYKTARGYFERAAKLGFAPAHHVIGVMLEDGAGYGRDLSAAKKHYKTAAESDYEPSVKRLQEISEQEKK